MLYRVIHGRLSGEWVLLIVILGLWKRHKCHRLLADGDFRARFHQFAVAGFPLELAVLAKKALVDTNVSWSANGGFVPGLRVLRGGFALWTPRKSPEKSRGTFFYKALSSGVEPIHLILDWIWRAIRNPIPIYSSKRNSKLPETKSAHRRADIIWDSVNF